MTEGITWKRVATLSACVAALCFVSCSKKEAAAPETQTASATPAGKEASAVDFDAIQKELQAKEYEKAAAALLQVNQMGPALSEKDAVRYQNQMRNLQMSLGEAAERGDPKAEKAIAMLRMMSRENMGRR